MKKYIISLITILSSLFIIGNVKASGIEDVQKYAPKITDENIQLFFEKNNIDTSIYDTYIITVYDSYTYSGILNDYKEISFHWFNYQDYLDGTIKIDNVLIAAEKSYRYRIRFNSAKNGLGYTYTTRTSSDSYSVSNFPNINYSFYDSNCQGFSYLVTGKPDNVTKLEPLAYYTNKDIYLVDGTLWLKANNVKPPSFTYEIKNPSNNKWSIDFKFENLTNDYYYLLKKTINNEIVKKYEYPTTTDSLNVFYDNNFKMELYDKDNNLINSKVIDVQGLYWKQKSKYYVLYSYLSSNKIFYSYFGVLKDETCWFGETVGQVTSFVEKDCSNSYIYEFNKNNIIHWQIRDKEDKVLFQREISVIGDSNETYINLETELKNDNSVDLKINVQNFKKDSQYIVYRIDKGEEIQVENNKVINFKYNARIDVYVYNLNNTISSTAYKDIVVDVTTLRPSPEYEDLNSILDYFKNITEINNSLLSQFSTFWTNLKKSELYVPLLISFIGSCILCVVAILKR